MIHIPIYSQKFSHGQSSCHGKVPKLFKWDFEEEYDIPICVYIDIDYRVAIDRYEKGNKDFKFLWLLESPEFNNGSIEFVKENLFLVEEVFEGIFTYSDELASLSPKIHHIWTTNSWIQEPQIYPKSKLVSMITSNKAFSPLQKERVFLANTLKDYIDVFGRGFNKIELKEDGLKDYMFSICVENCIYDTYFTEKILDCFATGTVPIYCGTRKISEVFDSNGIIFLEDLNSIEELTPEKYFSMKESIERNFLTTQRYQLVDDFIFREHLSKYL